MRRIATAIAASLIAAAIATYPSTPAQALPDPQADYNVVAKSLSTGGPSSFSRFRYTIFNSTAESNINVKVIGCGGAVVFETNKKRAGTYEFDVSPQANKMGKSWRLVTTITEPNRETNESVLKKFTPDWDFSCSGMDSRPSVGVKKWSKKAGKYTTAKRGKTLKVTATKAEAGAKVTYAWKINGKVVDRDRSMRVKKTYVGKTVRLKVTVKKHGKKTRTKTISYRRAMR